VPSSTSGQTAFGSERQFNGVKVFSATMVADRERLGERVTAWLGDHPEVDVREMVVTQSSDEAFHCLAITVFYWEAA
jgi:hypothetical protein